MCMFICICINYLKILENGLIPGNTHLLEYFIFQGDSWQDLPILPYLLYLNTGDRDSQFSGLQWCSFSNIKSKTIPHTDKSLFVYHTSSLQLLRLNFLVWTEKYNEASGYDVILMKCMFF